MTKWLIPGLLVIALGACSDSVTVTDLGKVKKPSDHALYEQGAYEAKARKVEVPPSVRGRYKSVQVAVGLPGGGQSVRLEVPLQGHAQSAGNGVEVAAKDYLPSFTMIGDLVTSREKGPENPAVWLDVRVHGKEVFRGWVFRDEPDLMAPLVPGYTVRLLGVTANKGRG